MSNVLSDTRREQVLALGRLGWSLRRIEEETGVRRETASGYLTQAGIAIRTAGWHGRAREAKPAIQVSTDSQSWSPPKRSLQASACEAHRDFIEQSLLQRRNAMAIWQDLVEDHGFEGRYSSVRRFVVKLRGQMPSVAHPFIITEPGEEAQVDYGEGPMVRHPETRKYRRTRLFVFTLGYSRKSVRLLVWKSSTRQWAELHEKAFRRIGGALRVVVLDNLREGVLKPDVYDPALNPVYRDMLAHYGAVALACRVRDPDRKGKVESAVGHAQSTPLKGLRFESIEEAQAYLDRWEAHWADTRIHGTTKRQVAAMFAEEKPALLALPLAPFCYYQFGKRTARRRATSAASSTCSGMASTYASSIPRAASSCASSTNRSLAACASCPRTSPRPHRRPHSNCSTAPTSPARASAWYADASTPSKASTASIAYWGFSASPENTAPSAPRKPARSRWKSACQTIASSRSISTNNPTCRFRCVRSTRSSVS